MRINCNLITSNIRTSAIVTGTVVLCGALWGIPSAVAAAVTLGTTFYTQRKTQEFDEKPLRIATKEIETQTDPLKDKDTQTIPSVTESDEKEPPIAAKVIETQTDPLKDKDTQTIPSVTEDEKSAEQPPKDEEINLEKLTDDFEKVEMEPLCKSLSDFTSLKPINDAQKGAIQEIMGVVAPLSPSLGAYYYNHIEKLVKNNGLKDVHPLSYLEYVFTTNFTADSKQKLKDGFGTWYGSSFRQHIDGKTPRELFIKVCSHDGTGLEGQVSTRFKKEFITSLSNAFKGGIFPLVGFAKAIGKPAIDEDLQLAASTQKWDDFLKLLIS